MSEVAGEMMQPAEVAVSQVSRSRRPVGRAMLSGGGRAVPNLP